MFILEKRKVEGNTVGNWFPIWESEDGADTAKYLKECVENGWGRDKGEYRMRFVPK